MRTTVRPIAGMLCAAAVGLASIVVAAGRSTHAADDVPPAKPQPVAKPASPEKPLSAADSEFFEKSIRPLLHRRCFSCHSRAAKKTQGGLQLDTRAALATGGDSGPVVIPGKPDESLLVQAVRYGGDGFSMPPTGKLPVAEIAVLEEWVRRGAPFPGEGGAGPVRAAIDFEAGRAFWSFRPLAAPTVPPAATEPGAANPPRGAIDAFVRAELKKRNLEPSPEADRTTLVRRLAFDLTGLPPTPEEIDAFVADESPDAYERLVERLLASPHYGERWARMWLDLARYTDVTETWLESTGQSFRYRDWVVRAFADDLPYDRFVMRQLAADALPDATLEDLPALGFVGLSPTYWKELQLPPDIIRTIVADEWEERIDAVGRTFLGLTVACARCHDHKFDPISTEDYYGLAGVFASVRTAERPMIPESEYAIVAEAKKKVAAAKAEIDKLRKAKPAPEDAPTRIRALEEEVARIERGTPHYEAPMATALRDESLFVLLKGTDPQSGTKLEYRPGARDLPVFVRGNPERHGPVVPRRFLKVLSPGEPQPFRTGSGRLELAKSLVEDAQPLLARVIVNRIWLAHFGRGLVETPSDFGTQGARPSHPELLDDLAARFVQGGWSIKSLHREMVLSAAYRQSSRARADGLERDPDNSRLWRANRRRLEVEAWRDAMLAATGTLDPTPGGPSVPLDRAENRRRTLYGTVHRREPAELLALHDFPDANAHSPRRLETTTPLQGLFALNNPFLDGQAKAFAERLQREAPDDVEGQVRRAYRLAYGRAPRPAEIALARDYLGPPDAPPAARAANLRRYAQAILAGNEFLFVD